MTDEPVSRLPKQGTRFTKGRSGNPKGRPRGARHPAYAALDAIGKTEAPEIVKAVVTAAKSGDMRAAEIMLKRAWPERKGRLIPLDLPETNTAESVAQAIQRVTAALAAGEISPDEAQAIASVLEHQRRAIETEELEKRIVALEERQK